MKRIGIITSYGIPNHGAFLQAYALRNMLEELTNDEVLLIGYQNKLHLQIYYGLFPIWMRKGFTNPRYYITLVRRLKDCKKRKLYKEAFQKYYYMIPGTGFLSSKELEKENYDILFLGSDIIWDYSIGFFGHDKYVFGNGINAERKIAYAPSFGTVKLGMDIPDYVKNGINDLDYISVRDRNSSLLVEKICGKKAEVVLDPTFLWDFKSDCKIDYTNPYGKYIFVYGVGFPKSIFQGARRYANDNGSKIICLDSSNVWGDVFINDWELNPLQCVALFRNAEFVITSTFHGIMLALQFGKKIIFHPTEFILNKADDFMKYLGIYEPMVNYSDFSEKLAWDWDYDMINKKLETARKQSIAFLRKSLMLG